MFAPHAWPGSLRGQLESQTDTGRVRVQEATPVVCVFLPLGHMPDSFEKKRKMLSAPSCQLKNHFSSYDLRHIFLSELRFLVCTLIIIIPITS